MSVWFAAVQAARKMISGFLAFCLSMCYIVNRHNEVKGFKLANENPGGGNLRGFLFRKVA